MVRSGQAICRTWVFAGALGVLAACGGREAAMYAEPDPTATTEVMYVATQRVLGGLSDSFGLKRSFDMTYFRAAVSVPPTHEVGRIAWPRGTPDAAKHYVITESHLLPDARRMAADLARERAGRETLLFVHGYNNTLSEAMYRFAQIKTDFGLGGPGVLFSWQSAGDPRGYIYDRDSVLFARSDLVRTIRAITARSDERVFLLAHSMGAQLTMEALREIALTGDRALLDKVAGVVLVSPDIDPDLFRQQKQDIGGLPTPILIFVSREDRALGFASFITGSKERLGVISSADEVAGLDVRVFDLTGLDDGEAMNHSTALTSPAAVKLLRGHREQGDLQGTQFGLYTLLGPGDER